MHIKYKEKDRLKVKGQETKYHSHINQKKARVIILLTIKPNSKQGTLSGIELLYEDKYTNSLKKTFLNCI